MAVGRSLLGLLGFCSVMFAMGCGGKEPQGGDDGSTMGGAAPTEMSDGKKDQVVYVSENAPNCENDEECDDGDSCNGVESCVDGRCAFGKSINCNDGISCTVDRCDPEDGSCSHEAPDADGDGHGDANCLDKNDKPTGDDCDDEDPGRYPGNDEVCTVVFVGDSVTGQGDGKDEDCDPLTVGERDADRDGFVDERCFNVDEEGKINKGQDCDDTAASVNPTTSEVCDYFDNNCDGKIDEGLTITLYDDPDGDGFGGTVDPDDPDEVLLTERSVCPGAVRVTPDKIDCGPDDRLIAPDRDELCDGVDNNCNGLIDENVVPSTWYRDFDGDGWGSAEGGTLSTCERIDHLGWSTYLGDCDDSNPQVNPDQEELCDGLDNDCNVLTTFYIGPGNGEDDDGDGVPDPACGKQRQDCADNDPTIYPGAPELCDGLDNDCNGVVDTRTDITNWYIDKDGDGYGSDLGVVASCEPVKGRVLKGGDCNDNDKRQNPAALDDCTGVPALDDDCDGDLDEGEKPVYAYRDLDGDGYGSEVVLSTCEPPVGDEFSALGNDCDEGDSNTNPGAAETCSPNSTVDSDCDGLVGCSDLDCVNEPACQALFGLALVDPAQSPFSAFVNYTFDITVELTDQTFAPVVGADVYIAGPAGTRVPTTPEVTDSSGQVTFTIGVGMKKGPHSFMVTSGTTTPLAITVNAQYPGDGIVWTVLNRSGANTGITEGSFGPDVTVYYPYDVDVVSDGSAYIAARGYIGHLDAEGQYEVIAGTGLTSVSGDGIPALSASIGYPYWVSVNEAQNILYFATNNEVRAVRLGADPPTIHNIMGAGTGPIPGPAELADIDTIRGLDQLPNGHLLISTDEALLSYDSSPTSKLVDYYGVITGQYSATHASSYAGYGAGVHQAGDATLFWSRYIQGEAFGSSYASAVAVYNGTRSYHLAGSLSATPNVQMGEDSPAVTSHFGSSPVSYALKDSVGNLLFAPYYGTFGSGLWRIDTVLQRINRFAGSSSYDQLGADYVNRLSAEFRGNLVADVGPDGDLWLLESGTAYGRLRRIRKGGQGSLSSASLQMLSTDGVSYWPGEVISATVSEVTDGSGNPLSSVVVQQVPGSSWPGMSTSDLTDIDGISFTTGRAELSPGQYSLQTQILDLDDGVVDAEVLSYEVVRPPSGSLTTWMNGALDSSYSNSDATGLPALTNGRNAIYGMTTTSDGSVYISTYSEPYSVYRITPAGYFELVAGGNGNGYTGDGLAALDAQIQSPTDVAVDEDSNTLYIMCGNSSTTHHIRTVDLTTGIIDTFDEPTLPAGYNYVYNLQVQDSVMYLMTYSMGIVAIDTTASTPTAVQWLPEGNCSSDVLALNYCPDDGCNLAFRADGKVYVSGYFCGTSVTGNQNMIVVAASDGTLESIVVGGGNTLTELPYLGTSTPMVTTEGMAIDSSGNLYYTERSRHWLRKLTPAGMVSTVAGHVDQSLGAEDFRAGVGAGFYNPEHVAVLPDDSVLIHDASHYALRRFWP